jgi:hypothetical protein
VRVVEDTETAPATSKNPRATEIERSIPQIPIIL